MARQRALITNDDGVDSPGLHRLAEAAVAAGLDVVVAAPVRESSGSSASLSALGADGRMVTERRTVPTLGDVVVDAVHATPAFIAFAAVRQAFGPIDLVISGINRGPNTGIATLHSGTVGAALTAAAHGMRGLAVSLDTERTDPHWETAVAVARPILDATGDLPEGLVVNVNAPDVPVEALRGVRQAPLASYGAVQLAVREVGTGFIRLGFEDIDSAEDGSDAALVRSGYATVTALRPACAADVDLTPLVTAGSSAGA